jgi:hypothetical protein
MTTISVNSVNNTSGTNILSSTGSIIQMVQYQYSDVYESTTQNSEYDMPGVLGSGCAITPLNSSSVLLFSAVIHGGQEDTWRCNFFKTYYKIGSGSWTQFGANFSHMTYVSGYSGMLNSIGTETLLSSLATTSTVSFKITTIGHANGGYLALNQNNFSSDTSANNSCRCSSTITLYEISA